MQAYRDAQVNKIKQMFLQLVIVCRLCHVQVYHAMIAAANEWKAKPCLDCSASKPAQRRVSSKSRDGSSYGISMDFKRERAFLHGAVFQHVENTCLSLSL